MKKFFASFSLVFIHFIFAQNVVENNRNISESKVILVGYQFAPEAKDDTETFKSSKLHIVEIVFSKVKDYGGRHPASSNYYYGSDFIFGYDKFLVAPKIGFNWSANAITFGSELQMQTDFKKFLPRIMPFIGLGFGGFRLFAGYSMRLSATEYFPINTLNLGVTIPLYNFTNKSFILSK